MLTKRDLNIIYVNYAKNDTVRKTLRFGQYFINNFSSLLPGVDLSSLYYLEDNSRAYWYLSNLTED